MNQVVMCVAFNEEFCKDCFHGKPHFPVKVGVKCTQWERCKQPLALSEQPVLACCKDILDSEEPEEEEW